MDWVNLLQDGAIVCLAVALIVSSSSIHSLRKQVDDLRWSKRDIDLSLLDGYRNKELMSFVLPGGAGSMFLPAPSYEEHSAHGFKPRLFRKGDSVRLSGLDGEFVLTGYSGNGFSAFKKTGSSCVSTTVHFHADRVTAWKRNTGEWPVEWFMGTGNKRKEGEQDDHARRVNDRNKKNAAAGTCGSDKRK